MEKTIEEKTGKIKRQKNEYIAINWWRVKVYKRFGRIYYMFEGSDWEIRSVKWDAAAQIIFFDCLDQGLSWSDV